MNFIVVMNDTLRPDHLAAYGNDWTHTPNSARFAESAFVFDTCWVGSFPTIPNRTDLFTGRYGEPLHPWLPLAYSEMTLPEILRENGYVTQFMCDTPHMIQGGHNFDWPFHGWRMFRGNEVDRYGMDSDPIELPFKDVSKVQPKVINKSLCQFMRNARERVNEEDWTAYQTYQGAINWLERNREHEKFFLWIDCFDPHEPQLPPQHYVDLYDPGYTGEKYVSHIKDPSLLSEAEMKNALAQYAAGCTFVDALFGRLLDAVDRLGLADDTTIVWLSDHGTHLNEHGKLFSKGCQWDEVARTVHMIRVPGLESEDRLPQLVQPADLAPTLLELAGLDIPGNMQGASYLDLLKGGEWNVRDVAISGPGQRIGPAGRQAGSITARDKRWRLIDSPIKEHRQLFDAENDPGQLVNVIDDHPDVVERLHQAIVDFVKSHDAQPQIERIWETGDPGDMTGYVPVRPGCERFHAYFAHILNSGVVPEEE